MAVTTADVMYALLSLDAYNRGETPKLAEVGGEKLSVRSIARLTTPTSPSI